MLHIGALIRRLDLLHAQGNELVIDLHGVTPQQLSVLDALHTLTRDQFAPNQRMLEKYMCLTNPTMTGLLGRLEDRGLVERRRDKRDARNKRIYLTEEGKQFHSHIHDRLDECDRRLTRCLSRAEKEQLFCMLQRMTEDQERYLEEEKNR